MSAGFIKHPTPERVVYAVFEVLPPGTPIILVQDDLVFVHNTRNTAATAAIKQIAGVLLPDLSIAVLRMRMGGALEQQAGQLASTLTGGRIVKIHCTEWPSVTRCFGAISDEASAARTPVESQIDPEAARHLAAVQRNGWALEFVPEPLRTPEICLAAVTLTGFALRFVPELLRTPQLCLAAVTQNGWALRSVPKPLRTQELCRAAVQQDGDALRYVPEPLRTPELCLAAVQKKGRALRHVPEALCTLDLCLAAVAQNPQARQFVPDHVLIAGLRSLAPAGESDQAQDLPAPAR